MNIYKTKEINQKSKNYTEETLLFLHPEQIRVFSTAKKGRGSENARIRMAESIRKYGVLQPFPVRSWQESNGFSCYQLVSDEERFRAVCLAGVERIPCKLIPTQHQQCEELSLLTELREKNFHFLEEATIFEELTQKYGMKQSEIAEKLGISQSSVANKLRLLQLNDRERESIRRADLGERHARALLRLADPGIRQNVLETIILKHLSVAETERLVETHLISGQNTQDYSKEASAFASFWHQAPSEKESNPLLFVPNSVKKAASASKYDENTPEPAGSRLNKFVLHDLQPLYNSIDRTLSIFRKTGLDAECYRQEQADAVQILIKIPKKVSENR